MKKLLLKYILVTASILLLPALTKAQEYFDNTNTPRQWYYNNLESATAATVSTWFQNGSSALTGAALTLGTGTSTNALTKSLLAAGGNSVGNVRWNFQKNQATGAATDMSTAPWEWEFDYKNTTGAATDDPDAGGYVSGKNSWRYWLQTYLTTGVTCGLYVTVTGGNLQIRRKYDAPATQFQTLYTIALPDNTDTYQIRLVRSVTGYFNVYILDRTTGITTSSLGLNLNYYSVYNLSYIDVASTTAGRFEFDNFNFYQVRADYVPITGNSGLTTLLYPGIVDALPYAVQVNIRGDIAMGRYSLNMSTNGGQPLFTSGAIYKTTTLNPIAKATSTFLANFGSVNTSNTNYADMPASEYYYNPGNTNGTTANVTNYAFIFQGRNPFFNTAPTSVTFSVSTANTDTYSTFFQSASPYNTASSSSTSPAVAVTTSFPPVISYASPQTFTTGTAITPLAPTNTGGAVGTYSPQVFSSGVSGASGVAVNPLTGNIFALSNFSNTLAVLTPAGVPTTSSYPTTGYSNPKQLIFDAAANLYISDYGNNRVVKITPTGTVSYITGIGQPLGLDVDASGNVYVASSNTGIIYTIAAGTTTATSFKTGFTSPFGVAINAAGDLFVSQPSNNTIYKVASGTTALVSYVTGLNGPSTLDFDPGGNLTVVDGGSNSIKKITPGGTLTTALTGLNGPSGVAFDAAGNILVTNYNNPTPNVQKYTGTYYSISPTLPAGLTFNTITGIITGTPTASSTATSYTVTATNAVGNGTAIINIAVNGPSFLTGYAYKMAITLNTTGLGISSNLTRFPVLLKIVDPGLIVTPGGCSNRVQYPNGTAYDFAFTDPSASTTELPYQVESYDQTTGTLLVWVQIPTINRTTNNSLNFFYGNVTAPAAHTTAFYQSTWKTVNTTSSNYKAVWHFSEIPSTSASSLTDATGSGNDLIASATNITRSNAIIQSGTTLNGGTISKSLANGLTALNTPLTMSTWVFYPTYPTYAANAMVLQNGASYSQIAFRGTSNSSVSANLSGGGIIVSSDLTPNTAAWHYVVYSYDGTNNSIYVDGALAKTSTTAPNTGTPNTIIFGSYAVGGPENFTGTVDESRVISTALSADWVKAEYNNQTDPGSFTIEGATTADPVNVTTIAGGVTYTYNGSTYVANITGAPASPSFNGKENFIVSGGTTLSSAISLYGLTVNNGITLATNGQTLNVACNVINNGVIDYGNTNSVLNFNGSLAAQTYTAGATSNTASIGSLIVNNSAAGTVTVSGGPVNVYSSLTLPSGKLIVDPTATLTLKSTATATAYVGILPAANTITGLVSVERYLQGGSTTDGTGRYVYRNYRLLSSPVNTTATYASSTTTYPISFQYLANSAIVTGAVGGYNRTTNSFNSATAVGNPTIYLYRENRTPNNTAFIAGNFIGITDVTSSNINTSPDGAEIVSIGNGYMFFFRGSKANPLNKTLAPYTAVEPVTFTATGYLNQGTYQVQHWNTNTSNLLYTTTAGNTAVRGFNLVGNPYASSIDWEKFTTTAGATTGIVGTANISTTIYIFNPFTNQYNTYKRGDSGIGKGTNLTTNTGNTQANIIPSGQGFFVRQTSAGTSNLTFYETAKVSTQVTAASGNLLMSRAVPVENAKPEYLRILLSKDELSSDDNLIFFNDTASTKYVESEDAAYLTGNAATQSLASMSSDGVKLAINRFSLPKANETRVVNLNVNATASGIYTLQKNELNNVPELYDFWLIDKYKKDSLDIKHNPIYTFNIIKTDTATFGSNRFQLVIRQNQSLMLRLLDFNGTKTNTGNQLKWVTENEQNYTNFTIERSTDNGKTFEVIGGFKGNGGGTYTLIDKNPVTGINQYRLKQDDFNGTITYSKIVTIMYAKTADNIVVSNLSVFPNPATSNITVSILNQPDTKSFDIRITNSSGIIVKSAVSAQPTWQTNVSNLLPGTYIIQVTNSDTKKLIGNAKFIKQ